MHTGVVHQFVCAHSRCTPELGLSSSSSSGVKMEVVEEGSEPAEFIKALGPQDKKAYDCMLKGASSHSHSYLTLITLQRQREHELSRLNFIHTSTSYKCS